MNPEIAKIALQFMQRVQLQGTEVHAFTVVCEELQRVSEEMPRFPDKSEEREK